MNYYKNIPNKEKIMCLLCQHYCQMKEGQVGICGVNKNENGELKTLVYGHPSALNVDPVEKKPLYHLLPSTTALSLGTVGCNFQCPFCQNWQISQERKVDESVYISPERMVELAIENGSDSIAYTYNEPTIFYPYAKDIGVIAKAKGLKNIFVTNGFESPEVVKDMASWLDAANVDLKSWDDAYYKKILKGGLEAVKETLRGMVKEGIWVEVTTLLIEGENDSDADLKAMASFIADELGKHVPWHLSAFHPDYKMQDHEYTKLQTLERAQKIAKEAGLEYVYLGNVPVHGDTYCPDCGTLLIDRTGYSITKNLLVDGHCPKCNREIEGVWK
ncbi:AmmeMemoRadiSam system radical SAM enzyme [Sulfurimonas paralvinellae]|uniref:AmmeMemoRadiSam system radical SAM enzyme n=1 Tax=Sulfurimonas paralvinellae TaxID=317658 RepID=A0A7M1B7E8_9BACT|nr:AmmeMemoRadiSam system radical SAM enzyme [Sulfurimonas paralvinellae]QOP45657.1 AmmeMemoRadiSam system radical SAM enzyme [Sulfurimonas paralvinellae]